MPSSDSNIAAEIQWPRHLWQTPAVHDAPGFDDQTSRGLTPLFYDGLPFGGQPTRVFAWYGEPESSEKSPAILLVHGGGGTAFCDWVQLWRNRGYAALAMDLCGCVPRGEARKWERHPYAGPGGFGGFDQVDWPAEDQWTYHAVGAVIAGHSLLRSRPGVIADRIGITGVSWGGFISCIVAGVDWRLRFAAPVYGCGFLQAASGWLKEFNDMGPQRAARWSALWDPSNFLPACQAPMLWVNGTNDTAFWMPSWQRSYRLSAAPRALCLRVRMPHGHEPGQQPSEIHAMAEHHTRGGPPLATIFDQGMGGSSLWCRARHETPIVRAELNWTTDASTWPDRQWHCAPASWDAGTGTATAPLPESATVAYLNLFDIHDCVTSSEHIDCLEGQAT